MLLQCDTACELAFEGWTLQAIDAGKPSKHGFKFEDLDIARYIMGKPSQYGFWRPGHCTLYMGKSFPTHVLWRHENCTLLPNTAYRKAFECLDIALSFLTRRTAKPLKAWTLHAPSLHGVQPSLKAFTLRDTFLHGVQPSLWRPLHCTILPYTAYSQAFEGLGYLWRYLVDYSNIERPVAPSIQQLP